LAINNKLEHEVAVGLFLWRVLRSIRVIVSQARFTERNTGDDDKFLRGLYSLRILRGG
jgi:hypothetical protein